MRKRIKIMFWGTFLMVLLAGGTIVLGQTSGSYNLVWNVIGGGGGTSSSASYEVEGTIGQPISSGAVGASNSNYQLSSGFWFANSPIRIYLPAIVKQ